MGLEVVFRLEVLTRAGASSGVTCLVLIILFMETFFRGYFLVSEFCGKSCVKLAHVDFLGSFWVELYCCGVLQGPSCVPLLPGSWSFHLSLLLWDLIGFYAFPIQATSRRLLSVTSKSENLSLWKTPSLRYAFAFASPSLVPSSGYMLAFDREKLFGVECRVQSSLHSIRTAQTSNSFENRSRSSFQALLNWIKPRQ